MEGEWTCYKGGQFNEWRIEWSYYRGGHCNGSENGHVTAVASLMEGACSCYIAGQFNGGRMVMLQVTLMEGE